jgi:hypothetical protein
MNKTLKIPELTPAAFRKWLEKQPSTARFKTGSSCRCPIGQYTGGRVYYDVLLLNEKRIVGTGDGSMPEWMPKFMHEVDGESGSNPRWIGKRQALAALIKVAYR